MKDTAETVKVFGMVGILVFSKSADCILGMETLVLEKVLLIRAMLFFTR